MPTLPIVTTQAIQASGFLRSLAACPFSARYVAPNSDAPDGNGHHHHRSAVCVSFACFAPFCPQLSSGGHSSADLREHLPTLHRRSLLSRGSTEKPGQEADCARDHFWRNRRYCIRRTRFLRLTKSCGNHIAPIPGT